MCLCFQINVLFQRVQVSFFGSISHGLMHLVHFLLLPNGLCLVLLWFPLFLFDGWLLYLLIINPLALKLLWALLGFSLALGFLVLGRRLGKVWGTIIRPQIARVAATQMASILHNASIGIQSYLFCALFSGCQRPSLRTTESNRI